MLHNFNYGPLGWFGLVLGWIFTLLFWVLIIWAIIILIRSLSRHGKGYREDQRKEEYRKHELRESPSIPPQTNRAFDILKERYARGEIDKNEFDEKKKDLL